MEVCFTLFLYPFPSTVQNYIQLSPCTTNPWENELPGITNYTILQNKRMRRCGVSLPPPPPTNNFRLNYPNKLYIVGNGIYPRVWIILNIGKIFWFCDFNEQFSRSSRILGHFWSSKNFKLLKTQIYQISFWSGWSVDSKIYNLFREKFKFRGFTKAFKNFAEYITAFIFAKLKYFTKQIIYLESPDYSLQNDIWYVCVPRVWNFFELPKMA